ncbi:MAG: HupE/UreJ family protein [Myxococcota bacterium]|nr:HupE/UreJ family protein [Myxococcota bacterium]
MIGIGRYWILLFTGIIGVCFYFPAQAHRMGRSFSNIQVNDAGVEGVTYFDANDALPSQPWYEQTTTDILDSAAIEAARFQVAQWLTENLILRRGWKQCPPQVNDITITDKPKVVRVDIYYDCPSEGPITIVGKLLEKTREGHLHTITLRRGDQEKQVHVLTQSSIRFEETRPISLLETFAAFTPIGIEHIAIGFDHILFLAALLLALATWYDLLWVVTAFTLAHSVTLSMAALDIIRFSSEWVEPLIALSVIVAALENLRCSNPRSRKVIALALGLLHGFGFAGVLGEIGLPQDGKLSALIGFNLGVEMGQLLIALAIFPILLRLRHQKTFSYETTVLKGGSLVIAAVGCVWLVERLVS